MSTFEKVKAMLVEKLGIAEEKVSLESEIIKDLGADSLDLVEMLLSLEENFQFANFVFVSLCPLCAIVFRAFLSVFHAK